MGIYETVSKVNITEDSWRDAVEEHSIVPDEFDSVSFYRVVKKVEHLSKGAVVTDAEIIFAFPRIGRILQLENGLKLTFVNPFYVEERSMAIMLELQG